MKILAVCGGLREAWSNTSLLRALAMRAPTDTAVHLPRPLDSQPFICSHVEEKGLPPPFRAWRDDVGLADAIVISSPENAHGVSDVLKNAPDRLVGGVEINGKTVAAPSARPQASIAASLRSLQMPDVRHRRNRS